MRISRILLGALLTLTPFALSMGSVRAEQVDSSKKTPKPFTLQAEQTTLSREHLRERSGLHNDKPIPTSVSIDTNQFSFAASKTRNSEKRVALRPSVMAESSLNKEIPSLPGNSIVRTLAEYNIELIIDRSSSMGAVDCPCELSRWKWCGVQSASLAESLRPYTAGGLTIVPFASEYDVLEHATAHDINAAFNSMSLQGNTRLYEPLSERIDNFFAHYTPSSKPLLIVIVTDGVPFPRFEPALVRSELIEATQRMTNPNQVKVIFCQIGSSDPLGERFLSILDNELVTDGAKYDIVHTIPFHKLTSLQLGPALAAKIKECSHKEQAVSALADASSILNRHHNTFSSHRFPRLQGREPDRYADNPEVDIAGSRHFRNGRRFDLSQTSIDQALEQIKEYHRKQ